MIKRIIVILLTVTLFVSSLIPLTSCAERREAGSLMREFCDAFGVSATVYTPTVREGESGYVSENFFSSLYGEEPESVSDYAVILLSDLDTVGECGVFICYSDYDAILVTDMLERRIELIRSVTAAAGLDFPDDAFILRKNKCVVICVLNDAERAKRIWKRII